MINELIQEIDKAVDDAETNVLIAVGESYVKLLTIMQHTNNESIIQEYAVFTEASVKETFSNIISKIGHFLSTAFNKLTSVISKRIMKDKKALMMHANMLLIADALDKKKVTTESFEDDDLDDIYQEGLFDKLTPEEKANKKKFKALSKEQSKMDKEFVKSLKKLLNTEIFIRRLTSKEITDITNMLSSTMTNKDYKDFKKDINNVTKTKGGTFGTDTLRNLTLIKNIDKTIKGIRQAENEKIIQKRLDKVEDERKVNMDIALVKKFADTIGKGFNDLSQTKSFTFDQCMNIVYGKNRVGTLCGTLANAIFGLVERVPRTLKDVKQESSNISEFITGLKGFAVGIQNDGTKLYAAHHEFDDYQQRDKREREDLGVDVNYLVRDVMFALDNFKEETYGWQDDLPFNYQSYMNGNYTTMNMGGPCTMTVKLLLICKSMLDGNYENIPLITGAPGEGGIVDLAMMSQAKLLNPGNVTHKSYDKETAEVEKDSAKIAKTDKKLSRKANAAVNKVERDLIKQNKETYKQKAKEARDEYRRLEAGDKDRYKEDKQRAKMAKKGVPVVESAVVTADAVAICNDMLDTLHTFKYGMPDDKGNIRRNFSDTDYDNMYKLLSPEEFVKYGGGICYDYTEYQEKYLKDKGIDCKKWYLSTDIGDTHAFVTITNENDEYIYPESSFSLIEGVHHFKNISDIANYIVLNMFRMNNNTKHEKIRWYLWQYTGHPEYGCSMKDFGEYCSKGEPLAEGFVRRP